MNIVFLKVHWKAKMCIGGNAKSFISADVSYTQILLLLWKVSSSEFLGLSTLCTTYTFAFDPPPNPCLIPALLLWPLPPNMDMQFSEDGLESYDQTRISWKWVSEVEALVGSHDQARIDERWVSEGGVEAGMGLYDQAGTSEGYQRWNGGWGGVIWPGRDKWGVSIRGEMEAGVGLYDQAGIGRRWASEVG